MTILKSTDLKNIYLGFREISSRDFSKQIYYVEKHLDTIGHMIDPHRIEIMDKYVKALFEVGHYQKCLSKIDPLLTDLFESDHHPEEKVILCELLIRKACSQYNLSNFKEAEHIIKELIKIKPELSRPVQILHSIKLRTIRKKLLGLRSLSIMLLFFGLCITCIDLLVVQNFYPEQASSVMIFRNFILGISGASLLGLELGAFLKSKNLSKAFHAAALDKKSRRFTD